jgi:hypothetical protein
MVLLAGVLSAAQEAQQPAPTPTPAQQPAQQPTPPPAQPTPQPAPQPVPQPPYQPKSASDPARSQSEFIALAYMRTILDAQRQYRKKHNKYAPSLTALVGSGSFTRRMVNTNRGDYEGAFHSGGANHFTIEMTPKKLDSDHRAFWVSDSGYFHVEEDRPATADSPVLKADK